MTLPSTYTAARLQLYVWARLLYLPLAPEHPLVLSMAPSPPAWCSAPGDVPCGDGTSSCSQPLLLPGRRQFILQQFLTKTQLSTSTLQVCNPFLASMSYLGLFSSLAILVRKRYILKIRAHLFCGPSFAILSPHVPPKGQYLVLKGNRYEITKKAGKEEKGRKVF